MSVLMIHVGNLIGRSAQFLAVDSLKIFRVICDFVPVLNAPKGIFA